MMMQFTIGFHIVGKDNITIFFIFIFKKGLLAVSSYRYAVRKKL